MEATERAHPSYPIATAVERTTARTVVPDPVPDASMKYLPCDVAAYLAVGDGTVGPGLETRARRRSR